MTSIADRVREARRAKGMSQTALAGSRFSPSYISLIEAGRREPAPTALAFLAKQLSTTPEYLKFGEDAPNEAQVRLEVDYAQIALIDGDAAEVNRRIGALDLTCVTPLLRHAALVMQARALELLGDLEGSIRIFEPLRAEREAEGDLLEAARVATELVVTYLEAGDLNRSVEVGEQAMAQLAAGNLNGSDEHLRLGSALLWSYVERGDLLYAAQQASDLIRVAEELGSPRGRGSVYWNAAIVAEERADYEQAQRYTERALALLSEGAGDRDVMRLRLNYAWLLLHADPPDPREALAQLDRTDPVVRVLGSSGDLAISEVERARAHLLVGDPAASTEHARAALQLLGDQPRLETTRALVALGDSLVAQGDVEDGAQVYERAASMLAMMSATRQSAQVWRDLGDRYLFRGQSDRAALAFDRALSEIGLRSTIPLDAMSGNPLTDGLRRLDADEL